MGTEEGVTEVAHGFGAGLGSGQAATGISDWWPEVDSGFGVEAVGAVTGAGCVW